MGYVDYDNHEPMGWTVGEEQNENNKYCNRHGTPNEWSEQNG